MLIKRRIALAFAAGAALCLLLPLEGVVAQSAAARPIGIAIFDFDYSDTSGEAQDATAAHQARLKAFMASIRGDLAASGKYRIVEISCGAELCTTSGTMPADLSDRIKRAGADLLLFGGFHKESTLVQWAKVQVVDVAANKLVVDRLLTFRGDTDDSWRRAEAFVIDELKGQLPDR